MISAMVQDTFEGLSARNCRTKGRPGQLPCRLLLGRGRFLLTPIRPDLDESLNLGVRQGGKVGSEQRSRSLRHFGCSAKM